VLKYNASAGQAFLGTHRDGCLLTVTVALNSLDAYEGGGTFFEPLDSALRYDQVINTVVISQNPGLFGLILLDGLRLHAQKASLFLSLLCVTHRVVVV
jgi:hypothetical protein